MRDKQTIINEIIEYLKDDPELLNNCMELVDQETGCLGEYKIYPMEMFDDLMSDQTPLEIAEQVSNGSDYRNNDFNTGRKYFYWSLQTGYLVSTDDPSYEDYLDGDAVETMAELKDKIFSAWQDIGLDDLLEELDDLDDLLEELDDLDDHYYYRASSAII